MKTPETLGHIAAYKRQHQSLLGLLQSPKVDAASVRMVLRNLWEWETKIIAATGTVHNAL
jgi:hypothetical protein